MRISTLIRFTEDTVISAASNVARRAKAAAHATSIEYNARMLARAQAAVVREQVAYRNMSSEERKAAARDTNAIQARAAELIAQRAEPHYKHMRSDAEPSAKRDARKAAKKATTKRASNVKRATK